MKSMIDASELKKWHEFEVFRGRIVEMVCTQNGSKSLQVTHC